MPGQNANWVVVGANGKVYVAPVGSTAPTDATSVLAAAFIELGFTSEDGATITDSKEITDIGAWQSFYPIRKIISSREFTVEFALRQWTRVNVPLAFGGGTVTGVAPGPYTFTPPAPSFVDERAFVLDWQDGTKDYRLYIPRGLSTENTAPQLQRTAAADLAITFSALSDGVAAPYTLFTDDPAFSS